MSDTNPVSNEAVVLTATVSAISPATATPTGTVDFVSDGSIIGTGTLTNGQATLTLSTFALGNQTLTAVYSGDTNFAGTTSNAVPLKSGDGNQLYVNQLYLQLVDNFADPQGLANYTTLLANGRSRQYVVHAVASVNGLLRDSRLERAVLGSKHIPRGGTALVNSLYEATLSRKPSAKELKSGLAQLRGHGGSTTLIINLLSSVDYFNAAFKNGSRGVVSAPNSRAPGSVS